LALTGEHDENGDGDADGVVDVAHECAYGRAGAEQEN
jgi:hypothetical protein